MESNKNDYPRKRVITADGCFSGSSIFQDNDPLCASENVPFLCRDEFIARDLDLLKRTGAESKERRSNGDVIPTRQ